MASGDIYVQVTASGPVGKSRSVIVLVPRSAREPFQEAGQYKRLDENAIAQKLAEPFAKYAFTHRTIFNDCEVSYSVYHDEPQEIGGRSPQLTQNRLKAWIV
jgi:hypothetical protein